MRMNINKTTKLFALLFIVACFFACSEDGDTLIYMAHPEEVEVEWPENIDYAKKYKEAVKEKIDSLKMMLKWGNDNLKDFPVNPEKELSIYWPDFFSNLPNNQGRMGFIGLEGNDSKVFVAVSPLGGYVFPNTEAKKFSDFFNEPILEAPDFDSIVAKFPNSQVSRDDYVIESGMKYSVYYDAVTGHVHANEEIVKALDAELNKFNAEYAAWVAKWGKAKADFYTYIKDEKYAFLKNPNPKYYIWGNNTEMKPGDKPKESSLPSKLTDDTDIATLLWGKTCHTPTVKDYIWLFNFGTDSQAKYERMVYYVEEENAMDVQLKKSEGKYGKAIRFHLDGYMQTDGTVKEKDQKGYFLASDRPNKSLPMVACSYYDLEKNVYGLKSDFSIENGYSIHPVRYSK